MSASGKVTLSMKKIATSYLWPWFVVDVVATFPFEILGASNQITLTKVLKLPRLIRLSRLFKFFDNFRHANVWRIFRLLLVVMMVSHWVVSGYSYLIELSRSMWYDQFFPGYRPTVLEKYFAALHASFLMMFGGSSMPTTGGERIYSVIMRLVGAVMQASIFGNVAMLLANSNASALEWRKKMDMGE